MECIIIFIFDAVLLHLFMLITFICMYKISFMTFPMQNAGPVK